MNSDAPDRRRRCSSPSAARSGRRGRRAGRPSLKPHERCRSASAGSTTSSRTPACARWSTASRSRSSGSTTTASTRSATTTRSRGANVLSRGIVGDLKGELVVASPVYKQHFSLLTGRCLEDAAVRVPVYAARVEDGFVVVEPRQRGGHDLLLLRRRLRRRRLVAQERDLLGEGRPRPSRQLRPPVHQGRVAAPIDRSRAARLLYPGGERRARELGCRRWTSCRETIPANHRRARPRRGRVLHLRPAAHRGLLRLQQARQGPDRHQQRRHQLAPVHVLGGRGLQADARRRCAAVRATRTSTPPTASSSPARNTAFAHPIAVPAHRGRAREEPDAQGRSSSTRARTDHRARRRPAPRDHARHRRRAVQRACCTSCGAKDCCDHEYIRRHTEDFDALERCSTWTPSGPPRSAACRSNDIVEAARLFAHVEARRSRSTARASTSRPAAPAKNAALINLHLATGQIGKPGAGPFRLTGQPNAMGGREVGGMANLLSAHRDLGNPSTSRGGRRPVGRAERSGNGPARPRSRCSRRSAAARSRRSGSPAPTPRNRCPTQNAVHEALERAELVVVQDAFRNTETCAYADVLLPAAELGRRRKAPSPTPSGASRACAPRCRRRARRARTGRSWWISRGRLARRDGDTLFPYADARRDLQRASRDHARARPRHHRPVVRAAGERGPQQWPYPGGRGERPHAALRGRHLPDAVRPRALRADASTSPPAEEPDARISVAADHRPPARPVAQHDAAPASWRASSATARSREIAASRGSGTLGLEDGELVRITSRRGSVVMKARASDDMRPGDAFVAMHWGGRFWAARGINALTLPALDPVLAAARAEARRRAHRAASPPTLARHLQRCPRRRSSSAPPRRSSRASTTPRYADRLDRTGVRLSLAAEKPRQPASPEVAGRWLFEQGTVRGR